MSESIQQSQPKSRSRLRLTWREYLFAAIALGAMLYWVVLNLENADPPPTGFVTNHDAATELQKLVQPSGVSCTIGNPQSERGSGVHHAWAVWKVPVDFGDMYYDGRLLTSYRGFVNQSLTARGAKVSSSGQMQLGPGLREFSLGYTKGEIEGRFSAQAYDQGNGKFVIVCFASEEPR